MAEVPEVQVIVDDLRQAVVGRRLLGAAVPRVEVVRFPEPARYAELLAGRQVTAAERRGKHILLTLGDALLLEFHLMLWGKLRLQAAQERRLPETMLVIAFEDGDELRFADKLGYARTALAPPSELAHRLGLDALGPDALDPLFDLPTLHARLAKRRGVLKTVLLNQQVFVGLGNRDADESLWLAQIDPRRTPQSLTENELARLFEAIQRVLHEGLALRGTQPDLFGNPGGAKHRRYVFERTGLPCPRCGTRIAHLRLGARNTHFCPACQC